MGNLDEAKKKRKEQEAIVNSLLTQVLGRPAQDKRELDTWINNYKKYGTETTISELKRTSQYKAANPEVSVIEDETAKETARIAEEQRLIKERTAELSKTMAGQREGLINEAQTSGTNFLNTVKSQRASRLTELEKLLAEAEARKFSETSPEILQTLETRGLLHSSGVGEELAKEKGRLSSITSEILRGQSLADLDVEQQLAKEIQDKVFGIKSAGYGFEQQLQTGGFSSINELERLAGQSMSDLARAGIERQYSLEDIQSNEELAREIAKINADASEQSSLYNLLGTGAGVAAGILL